MTRGSDIAFVLADMGGGGAQRVAATMANYWARQGRRMALITLGPVETDAYPLDPAVLRIATGGLGASTGAVSAAIANIRRVRRLRGAIRRVGARTVVSFIAPTNVLTVMATRGLRVRVIVSERNDPSLQSFGRLWDWLRRRVYPLADRVTANSQGALDALAGFVERSRLALIPNPVAIPAVARGKADREAMILAVGRLHRQKACDLLLIAFAEFAKEYPDWRLCILGDGAERNTLTVLADSLGISHSVEWMGHVNDPAPFYYRAAIFAMPSRHEGMPNALLEAMAHGLPPVISDCSPGPLEIVAHGQCGLVMHCGDAASLAAALRQLAGNASLRQQLGAAAAEAVAGRTVEHVAAAWDRVLAA